jgi:hypothetical protein
MRRLWGMVLLVVTCVGCGDLARWNARMHGAQPSCAMGQVLVNGQCQQEKAR